MRIKKMILHNFKCHKEREIDFSDGITRICGINSIGKTSVFDAYLWTLFDRNAEGTNNPVVRPKDSDGEFIENVDVSVELTVVIDDAEHIIKKIQKRLSNGKGNKNEYEIDGHPMTKREFNEFILKLLNVGDDFDLLSDPYALMKQHWEKIREKITSTVDSISDTDIAEMYGEKYSLIIPELKYFKADDILKKHKRAKNDLINKQNELKIRIDEASKRIVIADIPALEAEKTAKEVALQKVEDELSGGNSKLVEINAKREEIINLKLYLSEIQNIENQKLMENSKQAREKVSDAERAVSEIKHKIALLSDKINTVHAYYEDKKREVSTLWDEHESVKSKVFPEMEPFKEFVPPKQLGEEDFTCPLCGHELSEEERSKKISEYEEKLSSMKAEYDEEKTKYEADYEAKRNKFKTERDEKINRIVVAGKKASVSRDEFKAKEEELRSQIAEYSASLVKAQEEQKKAEEELKAFPTIADVSENAEYIATTEKISVLEKEIENMSSSTSGRAELETKKAVLKDEIAEISGKILAADNTKVKADIEKYEAKVVETGQNIANESHFIALTEDFVRAKMNMISDKINGLFKLVKWKLFQNLENGGVRETCVCTVNGIDYPEVNAGHKILAGLDIINTLSSLCGARLPIFIDSAGELNTFNLPKMENQIILLKVTDDKELRVESEDK